MQNQSNFPSSRGYITSNNGTSQPSIEQTFTFEIFAPTLAQCYFIVIFGYTLAKFNIFSTTDVRGVSAFASYVGMPAIICLSLADSDLTRIHWELIVGIALGKAIVFCFISITVYFLICPRAAYATIYALFCVQCNDLPVGCPIITSLYHQRRPHMVTYLFFIPLVTLVIFGPVVFITLEKNKNDKIVQPDLMKKFCHYIRRDIVLSPVTIATVLGIILNLTFKTHVPLFLHQTVQALAATITGSALSVLGFNICGREQYLIKYCIIGSLVLVVIKIVFTPIILHSMMTLFALSKESRDFATLYGVISQAAIAFPLAQENGLDIGSMAGAFILSSLSCFPLTFVVAKYGFINVELNDYIPCMHGLVFYIAFVSLFCSVYTVLIFIRERQWKKNTYFAVSLLVIYQIMLSISVVLRLSDFGPMIQLIAAFSFHLGELSISLWMLVLHIAVMARRKFPSIFKRHLFTLALLSTLCASVISCCLIVLSIKLGVKGKIILVSRESTYDRIQLVMTSAVTSIGAIVSCIGIGKYFRGLNESTNNNSKKSFGIPMCNSYEEFKTSMDYGLFRDFSDRTATKLVSTLWSGNEMRNYCGQIIANGKRFPFGSKCTSRIFSLFFVYVLISLLRITYNFLVLSGFSENAILLPLVFLQSCLFIGQGIASFFIFGIDVRTLTISIRKWFHSPKESNRSKLLTDKANLENLRLHFENCVYPWCFDGIAKERIWKGRSYQHSFWGCGMVDWLVANGLFSNRQAAVAYANELMEADVIRHVENTLLFHDAPYLYHFTK